MNANATHPEPVLQKELLTVVKFSSALSLGSLAAFIGSIREVNPHVQFSFGAASVLAFGLGGALSWALLRAVLESSLERRSTRAWIYVLTGVMVLGTLAGYAYALASLPHGRLRDMVFGSSAAVVVLTLLGILFWKVTRAFEDPVEDSNHPQA